MWFVHPLTMSILAKCHDAGVILLWEVITWGGEMTQQVKELAT